MPSRSSLSGVWLLAFAAVLGAGLLAVPPFFVSQLATVRQLGEKWMWAYLAVVGTGGLLLAGSSVWILVRLWRRTRTKRERREQRDRSPRELSRAEQTRELGENLAAVGDLQSESHVAPELREQLEGLVQRLETKQTEQTLEIVAFGTISSGKSSLLNALAGRDAFATDVRGGTTVRRSEIPWPGADRVVLVDTPGLSEVDGAEHVQAAAEAARDADLVLVVLDGPLRDSEHQLLARLGQMDKRLLVCLNKQDWLSGSERQKLLGQLAEQLAGLVAAEDVVAVSSQTTLRTRMRVLSDGAEQEERVPVPADIAPLAARMMATVRRDGHDLLLANLLLQSRGLVEQAREQVREALDSRAREIVDRYTWGAGGAAALCPSPVLDLVAGSAITTKMVVDLARVYRQDVDMEAAVRLLGELGKNLIAILGVSAVSPAVAAAVASLVKSVPGAGWVVGGLLQGFVQAFLARWIGGVFMQYFRDELQREEGGLAGIARREWDRLTTLGELKKLVVSARQMLSRNASEPRA